MPEERLKNIEERNKNIDQKIMSMLIATMIAVCGWYLNSINIHVKSTDERIAENNLVNKELMIRMLKTEEDVKGNKTDIKELSKRAGSLERVVEGHERQLRGK